MIQGTRTMNNNTYKSMRFSVLGGDLRQLYVASGLSKAGCKVKLYGFDGYTDISEGITLSDDLKAALNGCNYIILPLPYSTDGVYLNSPYSKKKTKMSEIYDLITKDTLVLGGKFSSRELNERGIKTVDYFEREELQILNAVPTAEGAIQTAMEERPYTLSRSDCLVVGYGRIGKILSSMLKGMNVNVTVSARKFEDLAWIKAYGMTPILTSELESNISRFDVVFNTVPAPVIDKSVLKNSKKSTLFIDLASKPGGIDFEEARLYGIDTVWSLSLPGKVAPATAGEFVKETVLNIIEQENGRMRNG